MQIPKLCKWWDQHNLTWTLEARREGGIKNGMAEHLCWVPGEKVAKICFLCPFICPKGLPWPVVEEEGEGENYPGQEEMPSELRCWGPTFTFETDLPHFSTILSPEGLPDPDSSCKCVLFCARVHLFLPHLRCGEGQQGGGGRNSMWGSVSVWGLLWLLGCRCGTVTLQQGSCLP